MQRIARHLRCTLSLQRQIAIPWRSHERKLVQLVVAPSICSDSYSARSFCSAVSTNAVADTNPGHGLGRRGRRKAAATAANAQVNGQGSVSSRMHWNVYHEIVVKKKTLPDVFEQLQVQVKRGLRLIAVRHAIDAFYFHCVQQADSLTPEFREQVIAYFNDELFQIDARMQSGKPFVLGETLNEAVFGSVIKLHLVSNNTQAAWDLVEKLYGATQAKLHFRTIGPILEHQCHKGDFLRAFARWQHVKHHNVEWTKTMENILVQMVISCHWTHDRGLTTSEQFHDQMHELLRDLRLACKEITHSNSQRIRQAFHSAGYISKTLASDAAMTPTCSCCRLPLLKKDMSEAERLQLLTAIESRESKVMRNGSTAKEFLEPFKHWLLTKHMKAESNGKLHFILDGPNIAYLNQNFDAGICRLDHVDAVAEMLLAEGHQVSITMPFSYLADKYALRIRTKKTKQQRRQGKIITRTRTNEEKRLIEKWQQQNLVFSCRTDYLSDDLFWLYASVLLGRSGRVITNDQGRDHVFALLNSNTSQSKGAAVSTQDNHQPRISMDLIDRWKELTIVNIEIRHEDVTTDANADTDNGNRVMHPLIPIEEIRLLHPLPFSRVPQVTAPSHFHFPITTELPSGVQPVHPRALRKKWLCVHRKDDVIAG